MDLLTQGVELFWHIGSSWILPILFVLTLVVFFHELGHFLVARWCNVSVEAFSIGFGKEIFGYTDHKNTRWKFCWIPLGGYVKFEGDANAASAPNQEAFEDLPADTQKNNFHFKPLWQKSLVVAAGPIASFILGILIFSGINYVKGHYGPTSLIGEVIKGGEAEKVGLIKGDIITHINDNETIYFSDLYRIISLSRNEELKLTILRGAETFNVKARPETTMVDNGLGRKVSMGRIGIAPSKDRDTWKKIEFTPFEALIKGFEQTQFIITSTLRYIGKIFTGHESTDKLNGPIGIGKIVNQFSELGFVSTLYIAGLLSVSIGLFNLFPIPMLDGGHLFFYAIEAVRGRPASDKFMEYSFRVGLAALVALMLLATKNDISWFN